MKLKHIFFAMAASIAVLAGCQKPVELGPEEVTIVSPSETVIDVPVEGTEFTVSLKATVDWALQGYTDEVRSWLSISPDSGKAAKDAQTITVKVLANEDVDRKADIVFYGNIMCEAPLTINQPGAKGDGQNISIADFLAKKDTETEYTLTGVIGDISNGTSYYGFSLKDETGVISCPFPTNFSSYVSELHTGDKVSIKGVYSYYASKQQDQCANGEILSHEAASNENIQTVTVAQFIEKADPFSLYRMVGTVSGTVNANYCSFDLKDESGTIYVYSVNNASEYGSTIKAGDKVTLRGAYLYYASKSQHEVVDCTIESVEAGQGGGDNPNPGTDPDAIFSADFTAGQGDFTVDTKSGPEGVEIWKQSSQYGMVATAYVNDTDNASESWLISPVIDLSSETAAYLSFEHACNFFADIATAATEATVKVRVEGGEWAAVEGVKYPEKLSWTYVSSGSVDLSAYAGKKIQLAFVYTSTAAKAGTWEIKNMTITSEAGEEPGAPDIPDGAITWEITPDAQGWAEATDDTYGKGYSATVNGISVGYYQHESTSPAVAPKSDHIRVYKSSALKIKSEKAITKVILYCTGSDYCKNMLVLEGEGNGFTANTSSLTSEWTGNAQTIVAQADVAQVRISKIVFVCE